MEDNLTDALLMAGAVLIFVIAITTSMSSFTKMRSQIDAIIQEDSKLEYAIEDLSGKSTYLNYKSSNENQGIRTVGVETVISSMYRVSKENYIVYINTKNNIPNLEEFKTDIKDSSKYFNRNISNSEKLLKYNNVYAITINEDNFNVEQLLENGLYNNLKGKKFKEYLGIYQENTDADESNRTTYRVITYVEIVT